MSSLDAPLADMMNETITVKTPTTVNNYGEQSHAGTTTYSAFIVRNPRITRDNNGREVVASATLYVNSTSISVRDQIVMPDGSTPPIVSVSTYYDENGSIHHQEVSVS